MTHSLRVLNRASDFLLAGVFAIAVVILLSMGVGTLTGQYRTVTVLTGSMRPTMDPGDVVIERPISSKSVKVGDVVTFHPPNSQLLVTHRVVEVGDENGHVTIRTKGDANNAVDEWDAVLPDSQPVWVKAVTIPKVGYFVVWVRNGTLLRVLLFAAPLILLGMFLRALWRPSEEQVCPT